VGLITTWRQPTGIVQNLPGIKSFVQLKNQVAFSRTFAPVLKDAMQTENVGPLVRGVVATDIRQQLGISLSAWELGKFKGLTPEEIQAEEIRQRATAIDEKTKLKPNRAATASDEESAAAASDAEATALKAADGKELTAGCQK